MKTNVQPPSILAIHAHTGLESQRVKVAKFILSETRAGRWAWISKIARSIPELSQKSSAARALNALKNVDIELDGFTWVLNKGVSHVPKGEKRKVEVWSIILKSSQNKK